MDMSDQMIKEMDSVFEAYETAVGGSTRAREERIEAIKRELKETPAPLATDVDYAAIARKQAEDKNKNEEAEADKEMKKAASRVVQKYFPPGMKVEEAFKLLHLLKDQGFGIHENRLEGARSWPDGELKPYREEATKQKRLALDPTGSMVNYAASKSERQMIIFGKRTYITIRTDGNKIVSSEGNIIPELHVP